MIGKEEQLPELGSQQNSRGHSWIEETRLFGKEEQLIGKEEQLLCIPHTDVPETS